MSIATESFNILMESSNGFNFDGSFYKTDTDIMFFRKKYIIQVKAKSYSKNQSVTIEQKKAFEEFRANVNTRMKEAEYLLIKFSNNKASERFTPTALLIERKGDYALLFDDNKDPDEGVAVCLSQKVMLQSDYL